ncbi:DUF4296 domain-containing protein [Flavobacterium ardleyense]|uniref:DUF4296 domain-containing protein n=1 Tax=Flavobacterium ardleyense TaxID=2038737 RepID=A0ABW5Z7K4_9FLAO
MKKLLIVFLGIIITSCSNNPVPKPDKMLSEEVMEDIMFDASILQVAGLSMAQTLAKNGVDPNTYIYEKYEIDSLTYHQNQKYYAADVKKYKKMHKNVLKRIEAIELVPEAKEKDSLKKGKTKSLADDLR